MPALFINKQICLNVTHYAYTRIITINNYNLSNLISCLRINPSIVDILSTYHRRTHHFPCDFDNPVLYRYTQVRHKHLVNGQKRRRYGTSRVIQTSFSVPCNLVVSLAVPGCTPPYPPRRTRSHRCANKVIHLRWEIRRRPGGPLPPGGAQGVGRGRWRQDIHYTATLGREATTHVDKPSLVWIT